MTTARKRIFHPETSPYVHCMSRVVRRGFLLGTDSLSGKCYDHRKSWIVKRFKQLSSVFAIDICAYAVMGNHYHLVLHIDTERAQTWDFEQVIHRWMSLYKGHTLVDRYLAGSLVSATEKAAMRAIVESWRGRLHDISWFMRCLNEHIARRANREDNCTGRFWEGRFKSQMLLDEAAILTCMMYVDLNPIRAGLCDNLQSSDFTSIKERILDFKHQHFDRPTQELSFFTRPISTAELPKASLMLLADREKGSNQLSVSFALEDYLALADWTGRAIRNDKPGYIPETVPPILQALGIVDTHWLDTVQHFGRRFSIMAGARAALVACCKLCRQKWTKGQSQSARCFC